MSMLLLFINATFMVFLNHPITLGSLVLMQTIFSCLYIGSMNLNFWYSYVLLLVMIGGLLILFIYMTSVASNEKFKFNNKLMLIFIIMSILSILLYMTWNPATLDYFNSNNLTQNFSFILNFNNSMSKFYNFPMTNLMIITMIYLLIAMIAVVKICKTNSGPLRQMF
uniref:NADH-ubiquinone oxidoreductase chain 6 n=1 Tax=Coccidula rufa TaxID=115345 RepID=A0A0S2MPE6_9CUCU|nr:NADH deshydrogenase subunit 6 [Coccidula rufa]